MNTFQAREVGSLVDRESASGRVVSLYSEAVNILMQNGFLISLVKSSSQMSAMAALVPELFQPESITIRKGLEAVFRQDELILGDISILLEKGEEWNGFLHLPGTQVFNTKKIKLLHQAILQEGKKEGLLGIYESEQSLSITARAGKRILKKATAKGSPGSVKGLSRMVGLGIGFTPSGDDFIAGALFAEGILCGSGLLIDKIDKKEIRMVIEKTNSGGRTLLRQTLKGHFPGYMLELAHDIAAASTKYEMGRAVAKAASHGETSGTDVCVGLLWFLELAGRHLS